MEKTQGGDGNEHLGNAQNLENYVIFLYLTVLWFFLKERLSHAFTLTHSLTHTHYIHPYVDYIYPFMDYYRYKIIYTHTYTLLLHTHFRHPYVMCVCVCMCVYNLTATAVHKY